MRFRPVVACFRPERPQCDSPGRSPGKSCPIQTLALKGRNPILAVVGMHIALSGLTFRHAIAYPGLRPGLSSVGLSGQCFCVVVFYKWFCGIENLYSPAVSAGIRSDKFFRDDRPYSSAPKRGGYIWITLRSAIDRPNRRRSFFFAKCRRLIGAPFRARRGRRRGWRWGSRATDRRAFASTVSSPGNEFGVATNTAPGDGCGFVCWSCCGWPRASYG